MAADGATTRERGGGPTGEGRTSTSLPSCRLGTTRTGPALQAAAALVAALAIAACDSPTFADGTLALVNGTLVSGTGAGPVADAVVVLDGAYIVAAGPRSRVRVGDVGQVVDVAGATILPGFVNAHVHDAFAGPRLETWALAGVTTVRDEGIPAGRGWLPDLVAYRDDNWNEPRFARLVSAGYMMTAPGGYGRLFVASAEEARSRADEQLDQGADILKVAVEDGIAGRTDLNILSTAALAAVIEVAHGRHTLVSAHVTDARFLQTIVSAGVDDAAHVPWDPVPDSTLRQMIARRIVLVPTLTVLEAYGALEGSQANLRRFVALGGEVALGNDYTSPPQNGFPHFDLGMPMWEIRRMAEAGMSPMQIIVAATRNAARVCGLADRLGTLEAGKLADVLVVNGDPLRDLEALTDVRLVIHGGAVIRSAP